MTRLDWVLVAIGVLLIAVMLLEEWRKRRRRRLPKMRGDTLRLFANVVGIKALPGESDEDLRRRIRDRYRRPPQ